MNAHIGLYFPYFHFPNDEWVKVSALYWDKMYRIVPSGYETRRDTPAVQELAKDTSPFINILHPEEFYEELQKIKIAFLTLIENHTEELVKYYGINNRQNWPDDPYTTRYSPKGNPKLAYLRNEKIEHELKEVLFSRGLGTTRTDVAEDYKWIGMHPRLANVYMAALAEMLARHDQFNANPVTNDPINYFAVGGFTFERLAQVLLEDAKIAPRSISESEIESRLAVIAIKGVMPKNIDAVPVEKILLLREKHPEGFGRFQDLIESLVNELPNVKEAELTPFTNDYLDAEFQKKIKPKLNKLDDALQSIGIETIPVVLNMEVKIPALLAQGGLLTGVTLADPILGGTAAVAMGLLKIIGDKRKAIEGVIKESDIAYLMHIREDLTPVGSLEWLNIQARKLLFGV